MTTHKHLIKAACDMDHSPTIQITLDALVDLGAERIANAHAFNGHTYGLRPRHAKSPTTYVSKKDLAPYLEEDKPKVKTKKKVTDDVTG